MNDIRAMRQRHVASYVRFEPLDFIRAYPFCFVCGEPDLGVVVATYSEGRSATVAMKCLGKHQVTTQAYAFMRHFTGVAGPRLRKMRKSVKGLLKQLEE